MPCFFEEAVASSHIFLDRTVNSRQTVLVAKSLEGDDGAQS